MEDIDGGLHPVVDGQSLDEDDEVAGASLLTFSRQEFANSNCRPRFVF